MKILTALALLIAFAIPAQALTITGEAQVTKPYSFTLAGYQVYLLGVDSMEEGQNCTIDRQRWECWAAAYRQLETIVSEGDLTCETIFGPDDREAVIAVCTVNGEDVGERFVRSGFGLVIANETTRYNDAEAEARVAGIGLWQGEFTPPRIYRSLPLRPPSLRPRFLPAEPID